MKALGGRGGAARARINERQGAPPKSSVALKACQKLLPLPLEPKRPAWKKKEQHESALLAALLLVGSCFAADTTVVVKAVNMENLSR